MLLAQCPSITNFSVNETDVTATMGHLLVYAFYPILLHINIHIISVDPREITLAA